MAYQSNIPQAATIKSVSRADILENFTQINDAFSVDHETFDAANGQGKHKQVTFTTQAADPAPGVGEMNMYAKLSAFTGLTELFTIRNGEIPIEFTAASPGSEGWTMTPGGLLIKWGVVTIMSATGGPFNYVWNAAPGDIQFSTQYFALAQVGGDLALPNKDVNAMAYVISTINPAQVTYRVWRRDTGNTEGTNQQPFTVWVLAIGVP